MTVPVTVRVTLPGLSPWRWRAHHSDPESTWYNCTLTINKPRRKPVLNECPRIPTSHGIYYSSVISEKIANDLPMYGQARKEEWRLQSNHVRLRWWLPELWCKVSSQIRSIWKHKLSFKFSDKSIGFLNSFWCRWPRPYQCAELVLPQCAHICA